MQSDSSATLLGGSMPMTLDHLFRRDPAGGIHALFDGRRVSFSFNTRVAIRKACDVLGLKPGDEILVPSWNCGSEIDPLRHAGLEISFYPVDRRAKINISAVAALITSRTKAVYVTHYFGFLQPALSDIRKLCDAHGLVLIEDCALSLLSGAAPAAGTTGDVALFCFYKFFPSLAGGALVINNSRFSDMGLFHRSIPIKFTAKPILRASLDTVIGARRINAFHSWLRPNKNKKTIPARSGLPEMPVHYYFDPRLQNAKSSTFTNLALRSFDVASAIAARRANYLTYLELLASVPGIIPLFQDLDDQTCQLSPYVSFNAYCSFQGY